MCLWKSGRTGVMVGDWCLSTHMYLHLHAYLPTMPGFLSLSLLSLSSLFYLSLWSVFLALLPSPPCPPPLSPVEKPVKIIIGSSLGQR